MDRALKLDLSGLEGLEEIADSRGSREGRGVWGLLILELLILELVIRGQTESGTKTPEQEMVRDTGFEPVTPTVSTLEER